MWADQTYFLQRSDNCSHQAFQHRRAGCGHFWKKRFSAVADYLHYGITLSSIVLWEQSSRELKHQMFSVVTLFIGSGLSWIIPIQHFIVFCIVLIRDLHCDYSASFYSNVQVRDLDFGIEIVGAPLLREPDGIAMSSRNVRLSSDERQRVSLLVSIMWHLNS